MSTEYESDPGWQFLRRTREQIAEDQSAPYDSKKDCWIPDREEGYIAAQILSVKGDQVVVSAKGTEVTLKAELISQMNPPKFEKTEDMSNLTFLNDASVLHNLRARYSAMLIYTYSGLFCVVINPYKRLPIYTDSVAHMFMGKRKSEMPPHLFAVSDEAYRSMLQNHENQSMLITGESGAGKTENTKKVISYFAFVGASQQAESTDTAKSTNGKKKVTLEDQIVQTNPVLEAFGNARTVRNNNSSRFGKFIRIHFSKHGRVASCDIEHYLLEKSRVIRQAPGERCYHIFYQMTSDYKAELKPLLLLDRPMREYWFVAQAELTVDGMDDAEEFKLTDEAFDILHFTAEEKLNCYKLMSAHMHIGNMKFKQRPREEQAEPDEIDEAEKAAEMYGVAADELLKAFTHPRVKVGTEWVNKGQNVDQVSWAVGAMGKAIYGRVFNWLVKKCNNTLDQKGVARDYFIGVLDIAGFEIFDVFFKAGVLAHLEDLRDIRLTFLIAGFQAQIRYCFAQRNLKERQKRFEASLTIQRNVGSWISTTNWSWFRLFVDTMPLLRESKREEILKILRANVNDSEKKLITCQTQRANLEEQLKMIIDETKAIVEEIKHSKSGNIEVEEQMENLMKQQTTLEDRLTNACEKLKIEQQRTNNEIEATNTLQEEIRTMEKAVANVEMGKRKMNDERILRENQIRSLNAEINLQQENIKKLNKERKQQDELTNKLTKQLAIVEQENTRITDTKTRLIDAIKQQEQLVEAEKYAAADSNRAKRKIEGELRMQHENFEELRKQNEDIMNAIRKKDNILRNMSNRLEDQCTLSKKACKEAKDIEQRINEIEHEIDAFRDARTTSDRLLSEKEVECDEMRARLEEQTLATRMQAEKGKKLESESAKLRQELRQSDAINASALDSIQKKSNDTINELKERIITTQKISTKFGNQNIQFQLQIATANSKLQTMQNERSEIRRMHESLCEKISELQKKDAVQVQEIGEFESMKRNITSENNQLKLRQKELYEQINALSNTKAELVEELKEANRIRLEESRERQRAGCEVRNLQNETTHLRGVLDDELRSTEELHRKLSIVEGDLQQWRDKFADKTLLPSETVDDVKKKQISVIRELEETLERANCKIADLEKMKMKMKTEVDEANKETERHIALIAQLEKKTKDFNGVVNERKRMADDVSNELEKEQHQSRDLAADLYNEEALKEKLLSEVQYLQHENSALSDEIKDLHEQLIDGAKTTDEVRKLMLRVEADKDDLRHALDEAEVALEVEEREYERSENEIAKIRNEMEKRIVEKEDQLQNIKTSQQRAIENLQTMLEETKRESDELRKTKTKLEADISEMKIALKHANEANEEARGNIMHYDKQISELQQILHEEGTKREHWRQQYIVSEKKLTTMKANKEELIEKEIQIQNSKKQSENEIREVNEHNDQLAANGTEMSLLMRKLDAELVILKAQLDEVSNELKIVKERSMKAEANAARCSEALNEEQKKSELSEKERKTLEMNVRQLQTKIDQTETIMLRGGKNITAKLEQRLNTVNAETEREKRRHQDVLKNIAKYDRKARGLEFEVNENKKRMELMEGMIEKLQTKAKEQKRIVDEAEEMAAANLQKYKRIQAELERAEDRAENAENSLLKVSSNKSNEHFDE